MSLGEKLKLARKKEKMTQLELAEFLGIKAATICQYENNVTVPSLQIFKKLCDRFELDANDLLQTVN